MCFMLVSFPSDKVPKDNTKHWKQKQSLKEGRFLSVHGFSFQSVAGWLHCLQAAVKQTGTVEAYAKEELLTSWWAGSREAVRGWQKAISSEDTPVIASLTPLPNRHHILIMPPLWIYQQIFLCLGWSSHSPLNEWIQYLGPIHVEVCKFRKKVLKDFFQ